MFFSRSRGVLIPRAVASAFIINKLSSLSSSTAAQQDAGSSSSTATYPANNPIEDRHIVGVFGGCPVGVVFDGHGGWQVAHFAAQKLVPCMFERLESGPGVEALTREEVAQRIIESFRKVDDEYVSSIRAAYARGFGEVGKVGACVCVALVRPVAGQAGRRELVVANAGDCRAVLGTYDAACAARVSSSEGLAVALEVTGKTTNLVGLHLGRDHNAREPREQEALCRAHPGETLAELVRCKSDTACYVKGRLQLTRSLGDLYLKTADFNAPPGLHRSAGRRIPDPYSPPYVSGTPEVTFLELDDRDK